MFTPKPRVVISVPSGVTEVEERSVINAAIEAGANDFIQKPLNAEQIHHIISSRFEGR